MSTILAPLPSAPYAAAQAAQPLLRTARRGRSSC